MGNISVKSLWNVFSRAESPDFETRLHRYLSFRVEVKVNENRKIVLSYRDRILSVHKLFLDAPEEVIRELARYVMGKKTKPLLRQFIQSQTFETKRTVKLEPKGEVYDLSEIMAEIEQTYFGKSLDLQIGWFGKEERKKRSRMTFGLYLDNVKAVKIHRLLDSLFYPRFFVAYIVYHEMLHSVIPGYLDARGHFRIHGPEFKNREREFHDYSRARNWEKVNREKIFGWA